MVASAGRSESSSVEDLPDKHTRVSSPTRKRKHLSHTSSKIISQRAERDEAGEFHFLEKVRSAIPSWTFGELQKVCFGHFAPLARANKLNWLVNGIPRAFDAWTNARLDQIGSSPQLELMYASSYPPPITSLASGILASNFVQPKVGQPGRISTGELPLERAINARENAVRKQQLARGARLRSPTQTPSTKSFGLHHSSMTLLTLASESLSRSCLSGT